MTSSSIRRKKRTAGQCPQDAWLTIPNLLAAARLIGAAGLVAVAAAGQAAAFLYLFLALAATDWLDGKLAVWLNQRTALGARLDSVADAAMYGAFLWGGVLLKADVFLAHSAWISMALLSYTVSCAAAAIKFGRLPSYHLRTAKAAWLLIVAAALVLFLQGASWPLPIAMLAVTIANVEAILLTLVLDRWRVDVPSLFRVLRGRRLARKRNNDLD